MRMTDTTAHCGRLSHWAILHATSLKQTSGFSFSHYQLYVASREGKRNKSIQASFDRVKKKKNNNNNRVHTYITNPTHIALSA